MKYILHIGLIFMLFAGVLKSQDISRLKVDEKIEFDNNSSEISFFIFIDINTCQTCFGDINAVYDSFSNYDVNIDFRLFVSGSFSNDLLNKLIKKHNWKMEVVPDNLSIYTNYFKINLKPSYMVFDKEKRLICKDKWFHDACDIGKILLGIQNNQSDNEDKNFDYKIISTYPINDNNDSLLFFGHIPASQTVIKDSLMITSLDFKGKLYEININSGKIVKTFNLGKLLKTDSEISQYSQEYDKSKNKIYNHIITVDDFKHKILTIEDSAIYIEEKINHAIEKIDSHKIKASHSSSYFDGNFIFNVYAFNQDFTKKDSLKSFVVLNDEGDYFYSYYFNNIYNKLNLYYGYYAQLATNDTLFYGWQCHTKDLLVFDKKANLVEKHELELGDKFRITNVDEPEEIFSYEHSVYLSQVSFVQKILITKNKELLVFYENRNFDNLEKEDESTYEYTSVDRFLHLSDLEGKKLIERDVLLPKDFFPFEYENKIVTGLHIINNVVHISKLELNFELFIKNK